MQTFLPYKDYAMSAACLDIKRLGKQRVECQQIYKALTTPNYGWQNHPAVKMWAADHSSLLYYAVCMCREWISRGYNDSLMPYFKEMYTLEGGNGIYTPPWVTDDLCRSHRSNLLRKAPEHYSQFEWKVPTNLPYVWPTKLAESKV